MKSIETRLARLEAATARTEGAGWVVVYEDTQGVLTVGGEIVTPDQVAALAEGRNIIRVTYVREPIPERTSE